MKKTFFAAFLALLASNSYAQEQRLVTLPNGALVTCSHPFAISAGIICSNSNQGSPTPTVEVNEAEPYVCDGDYNPYTEPDRLIYCAARSIPVPNKVVNNYQIGERYSHAYASNKMVVIGLARDIFNRNVVTYQWYTGQYSGEVSSFIVGVTEQPWTKDEN